jgi:hypothetical protein
LLLPRQRADPNFLQSLTTSSKHTSPADRIRSFYQRNVAGRASLQVRTRGDY